MKKDQPTKKPQPPPQAEAPKEKAAPPAAPEKSEPAAPEPTPEPTRPVDANLMSEGEPPAPPPQDDESLIRAKMAAGLSRKQAEQVLASQRAIDATR